MFSQRSLVASFVLCFTAVCAVGQNAPNVSQVLMWSTLTNKQQIVTAPGLSVFDPSVKGTLPLSLLSVYTEKVVVTDPTKGQAFLDAINSPNNYRAANQDALSSALSTNIALALSVTPFESPTSGRILKKDEATGVSLPVNSTLGPIFTQRAETLGKKKFYIGITHQNYHFNSFNGQSLNSLSLLYKGGDISSVANAPTQPATLNVGMDVRLSQDIAFLTYGLTDRIDVSVGLPMVHAAVASRSHDAIIYSGNGLGTNGSNCWCMNTFTPGSFALTAPGTVGQSSLGKTGFGDLVVRVKGSVLQTSSAVVAAGVDLRFPTGDASNYLGTGAASFKPFVAVSLYSKPLANGIVIAPHADIGYQYSGKSILGGTLQATQQALTIGGASIPYYTYPFTNTKDSLPDVFSWAIGTEIAFGTRNTLVVDALGNQIGLVNGVPSLVNAQSAGFYPTTPGNDAGAFKATGLTTDGTKTSFGQYSGAFGYKGRIAGSLVATFQVLVRFDHNGLRAGVTPLYGIGYSF